MVCDVGVLVDGENISPTFADEIFEVAARHGRVDVARVFMNAQRSSDWHTAHAYQMIHSGPGKNTTDLHLAMDAIELALTIEVACVVIASSDSDFCPLHHKLRRHGIQTVAMTETKATQALRSAATTHVTLSKAPPDPIPVTALDKTVQTTIAAANHTGAGMLVTDLNAALRHQHGVKISTLPERSWRAYLTARPAMFDVDPKGPEARVRVVDTCACRD